jgi:NAD(P)-dependent dehydrogenase (short-subunit alcohol dehydrogenase family)
MGERFKKRRVLITGASRGIGASIAERLAAEGADVALVARTLEEHEHLDGSLVETSGRLERYGGGVVLIAANLAEEEERLASVARAEAELGGSIEILVNNAAAAIYAPIVGFPLRRRRILFEVNVHAPLDLANAVIPAMRDAGEGWIVNVSSRAAILSAGPPFDKGALGSTTALYGASKAALNKITNALGVDLHGAGVRVNTVEPRSSVLSEGAQALVGATLRPDQVESMEEMVEAVMFLCDCEPDFTAQNCVSLELIRQFGLTVHELDGTGRVKPSD